MMNQELAVKHGDMMPAMTIKDAVNRYNAVVEFTKTVMQDGKDYGKVPGTDKPTLLKPGAEKLCTLFGLHPRFVELDNITDFDRGLIYYRYKCELTRNGQTVGEGIGSCNSKETKYRYRWINSAQKPDRQLADQLKAQGVGRWRKQGGDWVWQERAENTEPFDLINTIDKMAQKRALVAATLIAANASEFFTQDVEDLDIIEGDYVETEPAPKQQPKQEPKQEQNGGSVYDAVVEAGLSENVHAARNALAQCQTGYDTPEKAVAWMKLYRAWRDSGADSKVAATHANKGNSPT